nr:venom gland protein U1-PHTX-Pmx1a_1 [Physocyclus mexicanus]
MKHLTFVFAVILTFSLLTLARAEQEVEDLDTFAKNNMRFRRVPCTQDNQCGRCGYCRCNEQGEACECKTHPKC